jgi:acyl-CoA synthetase (AMP-forming)/AMP-acid ligase II
MSTGFIWPVRTALFRESTERRNTTAHLVLITLDGKIVIIFLTQRASSHLDTILLDIRSQPASWAKMNARYAAWLETPVLAGNLGTVFGQVALSRGDHHAIETNSGAFSYNWLIRAALSVRNCLCSRSDYVPGASVALLLSNSAEYLAAFYGTLLADCIVVPLPVASGRLWREKIYEECRPFALISRVEDLGRKASDSIDITLSLSDDSNQEMTIPKLTRRDSDLAMLLFTSGSTGLPKGVMLSHQNLLANTNSILHELPIRPDDRALCVLPFCHAFGNSILQTHILSGATLLLFGSLPFPNLIVEAMRDWRATTFSAVPELYRMLLNYGRLRDRVPETLRYMTIAGGKLREDLCVEVADQIAPAKFYVMYGQSEATARLALLEPNQLDSRPGSIGKPIHGVEFRIVDEYNRTLPPGVVGMLCARGQNIMRGYWCDPAATAQVLTNDGWLRTGDLAHYDDGGYYFLHGRANLLVKIQGYRVHPAEIEAIVEEACPDVAAVAIPITHNEETRFVLFLAARNRRPVDLESVRTICQRELPSYKLPVHFELLDQFPLTVGQKVDRAALEVFGRRLIRPAA